MRRRDTGSPIDLEGVWEPTADPALLLPPPRIEPRPPSFARILPTPADRQAPNDIVPKPRIRRGLFSPFGRRCSYTQTDSSRSQKPDPYTAAGCPLQGK